MSAHEVPRYLLEQDKIVVLHDGMREEIETGCDEALALAVRETRLIVACGASGLAIFGLDDPTMPKFLGRRPSKKGPCIGIDDDDACVVASKPTRTTFRTQARIDAIEWTACSLRPATTVEGRVRRFDVTFEKKRCSSDPPPENAILLSIHVEEDVNENVVVLEADAPEDLKDPVSVVAEELETRILRTWKSARARTPELRKWYGWQVIVMDASSAVACATLVLCPLGVLGYAFGAPIVHWAHGHSKRGWLSVSLRLGLPAAGLVTGLLFGGIVAGATTGCPSCQTEAYVNGMGIGVLAGGISGVVAMPIIDALIAFDLQPSTKVVPIVVPAQGGLALGLGGMF
jgi:hypothetical protein